MSQEQGPLGLFAEHHPGLSWFQERDLGPEFLHGPVVRSAPGLRPLQRVMREQVRVE
jgi:hypothetical protein